MVPAYVCGNSREAASLQKYRRINLGAYTCLSLSFLGPIHPVLESVYQCLPGGFDDVFPDADGSPDALAVGGVYKDAGCGGGRPVLVEDAHLVVGEVDFFKLRVVGTYGLPEGPVEITRCPFTRSLMVASTVVSPSVRFSEMILKLSSSKSGFASPVVRPMRRASEASAAS